MFLGITFEIFSRLLPSGFVDQFLNWFIIDRKHIHIYGVLECFIRFQCSL